MPVRNGATTIAAAVHSVLAQQPYPLDVVVVVVGESDDDTLGQVPRDARVRVVHQHGVGLGAARNEGVAHLDTDLVGFCDADDRWTEGSLAVRIGHLVVTPACGAVAGRVRTVAVSPDVPRHRVAGLGRVQDGFTPGAVLIRRESVDSFDEELRIAADTRWIAGLVDAVEQFDLIDTIVLEKGVGPSTLSSDLDRYRTELLTVVGDVLRRRRSG